MSQIGPTKAQAKAVQKILDGAKELAQWYQQFKPSVGVLTFSPVQYKMLAEYAQAASGSHGQVQALVWATAMDGLRGQVAGRIWHLKRQGE